MADLMALARRLVILNREMFKRVDAAMGDFEFGAGSYPYLLAVYFNDGCTQQALSDKLRVDKAATTRVLSRLEQDGFIERRRSSANRREIRVHCLPKAERAVETIGEIIDREMSQLLGPLTPQERDEFCKVMARLVVLPG